MTRRRLIAGNWKLNLGVAESVALAKGVADAARDDVDIVVAPVALSTHAVAQAVEGSTVEVAVQNLYPRDSGAFTGELSAPLARDAGARWAILGHSERRAIFGEPDALIAEKTRAALAHDLSPIVCVGESREEREAGRAEAVVLGQLRASLEGLDIAALHRVTLAYEPVWAIGTGLTATPEDAQAIHAAIRDAIAKDHDPNLADHMRILYGGSVKPANAADLLACADIDGALVGGAALQAESFAAIIHAP